MEKILKDIDKIFKNAFSFENNNKFEKAIELYNQCLTQLPYNWQLLLFRGYCKAKMQDFNGALIDFFICSESNPLVYTLWNDSKYDLETRSRSRECSLRLRNHFTNLHIKSVSEFTKSKRIINSIWTQTHNERFQWENKNQKPQLFFIPNLSQKAVFQTSDLHWIEYIRESLPSIKQEYTDLEKVLTEIERPYLSEKFQLPEPFEKLKDNHKWTAIDLFKQGIKNENLKEPLKNTFAALEQIPTYQLNENPEEVFLSRLYMKEKIPQHYGESNHSITIHIPIHTPKNCSVKVNNILLNWQEQEIFAFDDTYIHEAENNSGDIRTVLIFSVWHPNLKPDEISAIKNTFNKRVSSINTFKQHYKNEFKELKHRAT